MELGTAVVVVIPVMSFIIGFFTFYTTRQKEAHNKGSKEGETLQEIKNISKQCDKISSDVNQMALNLERFFERLIKCEAAIQSAHKKLDELLSQLNMRRKEEKSNGMDK